jgi:hypothetical protein
MSLKKFYSEGKVSVHFDYSKKGYLIGINDEKHFMDPQEFKSFYGMSGVGLANKLNLNNEKILESISANHVSINQLEKAFDKVRKYETNNL